MTTTCAGPRVLCEETGLISTRTAWVAQLADPVHAPPWPGWLRNGIIQTVTHGLLATTPACTRHDTLARSQLVTQHRETCLPCDVATIRWATTQPDQGGPLLIDVGLDDWTPSWPVLDGNHRLAAAIVAGHELVTVEVQGDWDKAILMLVHGQVEPSYS